MPTGFRKRKLLKEGDEKVVLGALSGGLNTKEDEEKETANDFLTTEELQILQEFRSVGKRGISGIENVTDDDTSGGGVVEKVPPPPPTLAVLPPPPPPPRQDVVNSVAISQDSVHNTQTWKPILEEVKLDP